MDDANPETDLTAPTDHYKPHSRRRRFVVIALTGGVLLLLGAVALIYFLSREPQNTPSEVQKATAAGDDSERIAHEPVSGYDSPVGLLPPFHEGRVRSGKFSVQYTSLGQVVRQESNFTVNSDGRVGFEMIRNVDKVNGLLMYLGERDGEAEHYEAQDLQATQYVSFSFADIAGYSFFYDPLTIVGGHFANVAWAKDHPGTERAEYVTLGAACDEAYTRASTLSSGMSLNTANMKVAVQRAGESYNVKLDGDKMQQAYAALKDMIGVCYEQGLSDPNVTTMLSSLSEQSEMASQLTYHKIADGRWQIEIPQGEQTFELTVWGLSDQPLAESDVAISSYDRKISQYGIAYDACRLPPVVTSDFGRSSDFMPEASTYSLPSLFDSGYYCAPSLVKSGYSASSFYLKDGKESVAYITGTNLTRLQAMVELRHLAEEHYKAHRRYPTWAELFRSGATDEFTVDTMRQELRVDRIQYKPLPDGCSGSACQDFEASLDLGRGKVRANSYNH